MKGDRTMSACTDRTMSACTDWTMSACTQDHSAWRLHWNPWIKWKSLWIQQNLEKGTLSHVNSKHSRKKILESRTRSSHRDWNKIIISYCVMFYLKRSSRTIILVNKKKKENTLNNDWINMKICKTFNKQTVVDCDPPPLVKIMLFLYNFTLYYLKNASMVTILTNRESMNNKSSMKAFQG